jgi:beta-glucosidase-like glycosyl hydrolase
VKRGDARVTLPGRPPARDPRRAAIDIAARLGHRATMDAERTVARHMVVGLPPGGPGAGWERGFAACPPAGVILFRRDFRDLDDLRRLTAHLRGLARPQRLLVAADEEGGFVSQLRGHLVVPPNAALLARGGSPADVEWAARVTGERLRALGLDWAFAPVADVNALPANPVIGPRAHGADAAAAAAGTAAAVRGLRAAGAACCLKHFPGHGSTALDSHVALPVCGADRPTLLARDLEPFRAGMAAGAHSVMTAHVVYPALDGARPATFSPAVLRGLLRDTLGFGGVCITDALEMKGATGERTPAEAAVQAFAAGSDLLLFAFHDDALPAWRAALAAAVAAGRVAAADLDAARGRIEALARACPEPTAAELARPLDSLTPPDWQERLGRVAARGLVVRGALTGEAAARPWRVEEPEHPEGPGLADELARAGVPLASAGGDGPHLALVAVATRRPLPADEAARLRAACRERPTVLVGLQNDAFLDDVPEAMLRVSAADATPVTLQALAGRLAEMRRAART